MDRFIKGQTKAVDEVSQTSQAGAGHSKAKCRKYDEAYLALGFTVNMVGEEERPMCVLCLKTLAADKMKPTKLTRHIEMVHPNYVHKPSEFFERKLDQCRGQKKHFAKATLATAKAQLASYKIAYRIAQCKKPHTIAEELIIPAAIDIVSVMLDEASVTKLKTIPVSNDTISRRISDIANDVDEQLIEKIKKKRFALQVDEATDSSKDSLLIAHVRFVDENSLTEHILFCKYIPNRATADELFKIIDSYLTEAGIKWEDCLGICTDGAQSMAGKRAGLQALIKRVAPKAKWTHCFIHREALASRQLSPVLNDVLSDVVTVLQ